MKFSGARNFALAIFCTVASLTLTACHPAKKVTPADVRQTRLDWNLKTTVEAYQDIGSTNPKWDEPATNALAAFARFLSQSAAPDEDVVAVVRTNCQVAIKAGCDDPLMTYLYIKFAMDQTNSKEAFADAFVQAARAIKDSQYPPIRKFYVAARTVDQVHFTYGRDQTGLALRSEMWPLTVDHLNAALADKTMPAREAVDAAEVAFDLMGGRAYLEQLYHTIEKPMFENWRDDYGPWLFKGIAYIKIGWAAFGEGGVDASTAYGADLDIAGNALEHAWQLNTNDERVPIQMIYVVGGSRKPRQEMELWFARAMAINPNSYEACHNKLHYLYPSFYGSRDDMVGFGRECVANTNWGGSIPLILSDAHREYWLYLDDGEEKSNYWSRPDVWPDVKKAFDRFFALNPEATDYYYNYAWYAYKCGQWDLFLQLIPKLEPLNYSYFGDKVEFDTMVETAKKQSGKTE